MQDVLVNFLKLIESDVNCCFGMSCLQMPSSGCLFLSEEEEHTLISEGYPVPTRWPLTKQEEKILKKIQQKIKNKVDRLSMLDLCFIHIYSESSLSLSVI